MLQAALAVASSLYGGMAPDTPTGFNDFMGSGMGYSGDIYNNFDFTPYYDQSSDIWSSAYDYAKSYGGKAIDWVSQNANLLAGLYSAAAAERSVGEAERINDQRMQLARETNDFNAQQARIARQHASEEAQLSRDYNAGQAFQAWSRNENSAIMQRQWAEAMSNSQWQRSIADLKAAGMNPMLAYMKGPAGVPGGASGGGPGASSGPASGHSASGVMAALENPYPVGLAVNAGQAAKLFAEVEKLGAETSLVRAQERRLFEGELPHLQSQSTLATAQEAESRERTANLRIEGAKLGEEIESIITQRGLTRMEQEYLLQRVYSEILHRDLTRKEIVHLSLQNEVIELHLPELRNLSRHQKESWFARTVMPYLRDLGLGTGVSIPIRPPTTINRGGNTTIFQRR